MHDAGLEIILVPTNWIESNLKIDDNLYFFKDIEKLFSLCVIISFFLGKKLEKLFFQTKKLAAWPGAKLSIMPHGFKLYKKKKKADWVEILSNKKEWDLPIFFFLLN